MRLISFYTPSHKEMYEKHVHPCAGEFDNVHVYEADQKCPSASFKQLGWNECMNDKIAAILSAPEDGQLTLYVDADVRLRPGVRGLMEALASEIGVDGRTIAFSDDVVQWCAGVMLFRSTPTITRWWQMVETLTDAWNSPDQEVIHSLRLQAEGRAGRLPIEPKVIPGDIVSNWATIGHQTVWAGESFDVPPTCYAWHANWTIGVEAKNVMLELARNRMAQ
jgi:hypothetical protein